MDDHQIDSDDHQRASTPDETPHEHDPAVLAQWSACCRRRGIPDDHCQGPEAFYLVTAVETALRRGSHTPHLGRAARSWGIRTGSPGDAVAALSCLREVLVSGDPHAPPPPQLHLVLDQLMLQAVDAASGTLQVAARTDPLTGCANRRALADDLRRAVSSARQSELDLAVVAVDLDGLKKINDTHGHGAGDAALTSLVSTIRTSLRESDSLYRVGGDEFVVLAPFTDAAGVRELMRRVEHAGGPSFSWGVSSLSSYGYGERDDPQQLLQAADADLYERRRARRRRAVLDGRRRRTLAVVSVAATVAATVAGASNVIAGRSRPTGAANGLFSPTPSGGGAVVAPARAGSLPTSHRLPAAGNAASPTTTAVGTTAVGTTAVGTTAVGTTAPSPTAGTGGLFFRFGGSAASGLSVAAAPGAGGRSSATGSPAASPGSSGAGPSRTTAGPAASPGPPGAGPSRTTAGPAASPGRSGTGHRGPSRPTWAHGPSRAARHYAPHQATTVVTAAISRLPGSSRTASTSPSHARLATPPARRTATAAISGARGTAAPDAAIAHGGTWHVPTAAWVPGAASLSR